MAHLSAGPKTTLVKHMNGILPIGHRLVRTGLSATIYAVDAIIIKKQTGTYSNVIQQAAKALTSAAL